MSPAALTPEQSRKIRLRSSRDVDGVTWGYLITGFAYRDLNRCERSGYPTKDDARRAGLAALAYAVTYDSDRRAAYGELAA
jgi:hypothetical protein